MMPESQPSGIVSGSLVNAYFDIQLSNLEPSTLIRNLKVYISRQFRSKLYLPNSFNVVGKES